MSSNVQPPALAMENVRSFIELASGLNSYRIAVLGAVPAHNAEPDIHSLYRAVETVTED
jgi:hypothetical protein